MAELNHTENWLPVVGYEGIYEVSDLGRVRSVDRIDARGWRRKGRVLRQHFNHDYLKVSLCGKSWQVHRLVIEAFRGAPGPGEECCHNNGDGRDNRLANLRWGTKQDNMRDRSLHGTARRPESALTEADVQEIDMLRAGGCSTRQIARRKGLSKSQVHRIVTREHWKHVPLASDL